MKVQQGKETSIIDKLVPDHSKIAEENREYLQFIFEFIRWFVSEEIAFRGHEEHGESEHLGKWHAFIQLQLKTNTRFKCLHENILKQRLNTDYISKTSVNEMIEEIAQFCRDLIYKEIEESGCFSALIHESKDKENVKNLHLLSDIFMTI